MTILNMTVHLKMNTTAKELMYFPTTLKALVDRSWPHSVGLTKLWLCREECWCSVFTPHVLLPKRPSSQGEGDPVQSPSRTRLIFLLWMLVNRSGAENPTSNLGKGLFWAGQGRGVERMWRHWWVSQSLVLTPDDVWIIWEGFIIYHGPSPTLKSLIQDCLPLFLVVFKAL